MCAEKRSAAALLGGGARQRRKSLGKFGLCVQRFQSVVRRGGRPWLRPDAATAASRACRVDRPPALFSQAEENPRP